VKFVSLLQKPPQLRNMQPREQKNNAPHSERFRLSRPSACSHFRFISAFSFQRFSFFFMSYLSIALQRRAERRQLNQSDLAKLSGISRSYISRLFSGEARDLSDANFIAVLNVFATDPAAQAEIIAARCMDTLEVARAARTPGAELVEIAVKKTSPISHLPSPGSREFPHLELAAETERAFAWLRSQCPVNPDLEKHLVGYAKLTGMK
jgi:transcriptional regulator with XRE-family HTH domain